MFHGLALGRFGRYGVGEGDTLKEELAKKIHEEAEGLGERPPNFFK